jgi:hypothetical protein
VKPRLCDSCSFVRKSYGLLRVTNLCTHPDVNALDTEYLSDGRERTCKDERSLPHNLGKGDKRVCGREGMLYRDADPHIIRLREKEAEDCTFTPD